MKLMVSSVDAADIRIAPGYMIPVRWVSVAQLALEGLGDDVAALDWDWPPPYDGMARRAKVRLREKIRRYERDVLQPWQEQVADLLLGAKRVRILR